MQVRDAYPNCEADAAKLAAKGKLLAWRSPETEELVLYPKSVPDLPSISVDPEVVSEWLSTKARMPTAAWASARF